MTRLGCLGTAVRRFNYCYDATIILTRKGQTARKKSEHRQTKAYGNLI